MKKSIVDKKVISTLFGISFIVCIGGLTVFSSSNFVRYLNVDADMQYISAVNDVHYVQEKPEPEDWANDNDEISVNVPSEDGTFIVDQLSEKISSGHIKSMEDKSVETSDTEVSADGSTAATYPYYIGTEFVVVDPEGNMIYIVKKGDTLSAVSRMVGYSVDELAEYNHIQNVNLIYIDESIRIPADSDVVESVQKYIESYGTAYEALSEDAGNYRVKAVPEQE